PYVPVTRHLCLAVCAPGLEELCAVELGELGVRIRRTFRGGVEFSASDRQLYAANLWVRTATRVVVRVGRFEARSLTALTEGLDAIDWGRYVDPGRGVTVRVTSTSSRLAHTGAIAACVQDVVGAAEDGLL